MGLHNTSPRGLQELSNLGYFWAITTNKTLVAGLVSQLNKANCSLVTYELYSVPGFLLSPILSCSILHSKTDYAGSFSDFRPQLLSKADASCGYFETLPKKKRSKTFMRIKKNLFLLPREGSSPNSNAVSVFLFGISGQGDNILANTGTDNRHSSLSPLDTSLLSLTGWIWADYSSGTRKRIARWKNFNNHG